MKDRRVNEWLATVDYDKDKIEKKQEENWRLDEEVGWLVY